MRSLHFIFHLPVFTLLILCLTDIVIETNDIETIAAEELVSTQGSSVDADSIPRYNIPRLNFNGNKHFSQRKLRDLFGWQSKKSYSQSEIREGFNRIISTYRQHGYVFAQLIPVPSSHSTDNSHVSINVKILEGKRLRFGKVSLGGNTLFSQSEILHELRLKNGGFFTKTKLEQGIERIQYLYSEHGYPKVEIEPTVTNLSPSNAKIDFALQVREGARVRLSEVKVSGLQKTKPHVVLREIPLMVNEIFNQRKIDRSYHRLRNLGYFHHIQPNMLEEGITEEFIIFNAKVNEARTGRLIGVLGYAPPVDANDSVPQLTGVVEISETNLLGTGRNVNFYWKSGLLKSLSIGYREPWILGKPVSLGLAYSQLKQRNAFNDTESEEKFASVSANTRLGAFYESELTLGYKKISFGGVSSQIPATNPQDSSIANSDSSFDTQPLQMQSGSKYSVAVRFTRDTRDYYLNPTQGRRDSIAVELSRSDFRLRKVWLDLQQYYQTWKNQIVAIEIHGAAAWGVNIPPTELFYLGGANSLRGFDEDWFSGPRRANATLEYRFLTGRNSQIFTFVDIGSVTFIDKPSVFDKLRVGYGIGARLESKGGIIQLDYGLAAGDSALRGKIHVKLGASF